MSNAPLLMSKSINRIGHQQMVDSMLHDGLWDAYNDMHMGNCAEMLATERNYTRSIIDKSIREIAAETMRGRFVTTRM